jgi:AcrR family transcriptional regulator
MGQRAHSYRRDQPRLPAAERLRQITAISSTLIAECGFWGLSMQDVADRCGLTVPGVLRHVGSKTGLLVAVLAHRDVEDARSLREQLGAGEDEVPDEWSEGGPDGVDLRQLCLATMRRNAEQPEIVRLFAVLEAESLTPSHPAHDYFAKRQRQALSAFTNLAQRITDRPEILARHIVAMMDGLQLQWLRAPETVDLVREWESAAVLLFGDSCHRADQGYIGT